jgi:hypothetical protein
VTAVDIQQPDYVSVWAEIDEDTRSAVFPMITGEARRAILDAVKETFDEESRAKLIEEKAIDALLWRDVKHRADQLEAERAGAYDSWAPQDIGDLFDTEQQEPDIGHFAEGDMSNGGGVFYAGKVNEIHGPSESGKTMVVLAVAAQEIRDEHHVIMIDFEDDGRAIVNRLRYVFGLDRGQIEKYFHYFRPDVAFNEQALGYIAEIDGVTLGIIDAVTEGMSIAGLDGRNENEVATWYNSFPKKLAALGMGVVLVDHTPMENASRQIGSQHKKSAVDGVSYTAEPISPFVKGQRGHLRLRVAKDKLGAIRSAALPGDAGKQYWRGDFKIDSRFDQVSVIMDGVDPHAFDIPNADNGKAHDVKVVTLPSPSQAVVLEILGESGEWMSAQSIQQWHNAQLGNPKDPRHMDRVTPRKRAIELIRKGLAERRDSGSSVLYKITQDGLHSVNAWANEKDKQLPIEGENP